LRWYLLFPLHSKACEYTTTISSTGTDFT
jgi:hypothetical protein